MSYSSPTNYQPENKIKKRMKGNQVSGRKILWAHRENSSAYGGYIHFCLKDSSQRKKEQEVNQWKQRQMEKIALLQHETVVLAKEVKGHVSLTF